MKQSQVLHQHVYGYQVVITKIESQFPISRIERWSTPSPQKKEKKKKTFNYHTNH
jgi:hypothetical protein